MGTPYRFRSAVTTCLAVGITWGGLLLGCARHQEKPTITAIGLSPGNRCDPPGIPYYLPKPLLVISKNFRHIDESKVGLTGPAPIPNGFDNQAAYGDLKANVTVPSDNATPAASGTSNTTTTFNIDGDVVGPPNSIVAANLVPALAAFDDGAEPDTFFTYEIVFLPDLTQKYGLQISGGAGEFRAAMNLVNGWMYTGMGPYYFKDSSSAQNAMATGVGAMYAGRGASDVIQSVGDLASNLSGVPSRNPEAMDTKTAVELAKQLEELKQIAALVPKVEKTLKNYAEIYVYEPFVLPDQSTEWRLVTEHRFDRQYFASDTSPKDLIGLLSEMKQFDAARQTKAEAPTVDESEKSHSDGSNDGHDLGTDSDPELGRRERARQDAKLDSTESGRDMPFQLRPSDSKSSAKDAASEPKQPTLLPPTVQIEIDADGGDGRDPKRSAYRKFLDHFRRDTPQIQSQRGDRSLTLKPAGA